MSAAPFVESEDVYTSGPAAALNAALALRAARDWTALGAFCAAALTRFPGNPELSWQLSHSQWQRFDPVAACRTMQEAAAHAPGDGLVTGAIAVYLAEQGRYGEAEALYRVATAAAPDSDAIGVELAELELRRGAWREGWARYERRLERANREAQNVVRVIEAHAPRWRGENLAGRRLVVYSELGHGDDLQFVRLYRRFASAVEARGGECVFACRAVLHSLLRRYVPGCVALERHDFAGTDFTVPLMSMAHWLGVLPGEIDGRAYLHAEPARVEHWREALGVQPGRYRVGLAWAGSPTHRRDGQRTIPLDALAPLWQLPNVDYYPVAPGRDADVAAMRAAGASIFDVTAHFTEDFHDSAALLTTLDALVTIDSAPLHLGGALGRPVLAMIDFASHWCWGVAESQPWYDSVRLFRQSAPGAWAPVVERIAAELAERAARR